MLGKFASINTKLNKFLYHPQAKQWQKAQSAMEYLMTYGWAILIIAVVLAALDFLGVFNGNTFVGSSCLATPGYLCSNPVMTANANGPNLLSFNFEQDTGQTIYDVSFACSASSNSSTGMPNANTANVFQFATSAISSGSQLNISGMQCYGSNANLFQDNPIGTVFSGTLWIQYTTVPASTNYQYAKIAKITAKVESLSSSVSSLGAPSAPGFSGPQTTPSNILYYVPIRISNPGGPTPTSVPSGIISYVPITITNGANVPTSAPFQQMVNITESQFSSYNITYSNTIANFEFFTQSGTVIPAWIESNNTGKLITWVNLPTAIPASSSVTIYIGFAPKTTNLLSSSGTTGIGEAPQFSTTYAQYDDGAKVFNNYWNFAGTSLPSGWSASNQNYAVNNGLTISPASSASAGYIGYTTAISIPFIFDSDITKWSAYSGTSWAEVQWGAGNKFENAFGGWSGNINEPDSSQWQYAVASGTSFNINTPSPGIFSEIYTPSMSGFYTNYTNFLSTSVSSVNTTLVIGGQVQNDAGGDTILQWARTRAYPPNGVMPYVTFDFPAATGNNFQQMINITESSFLSYLTYNSNFANFEYFYANGTIIPAWIESNNSGKLVTWAKLSKSIPALSNATIYLGFAGANNLLSSSGTSGIGEAPQLPCGTTATSSCSTYAEYDDGAKVFNFYDNFAGNTLNSKWTYVNGITYNVDNGFSATASSLTNAQILDTDEAIGPGNVIDFYGSYFESGNIDVAVGGESEGSDNGAFIQSLSGGTFAQQSTISAYSDSGNIATSLITGIYSLSIIPLSASSAQLNYGIAESVSADTPTYPIPLALIIASRDTFTGTFNNPLSITWLRTRAYPPNGVMPSVTFGSVS